MKNIRKLSFAIITAFVLVGSFYFSVPKVLAAAGDGTGTINVDGGAQGAGVTVVQGTSHIFKAVLTIASSGITLGAISPTFRIPAGFIPPNGHAVATAAEVDVDGEWSVVATAGSGVSGCTVSSAPGSSTTVASGQTITVDITADCAFNNLITLTYQGTSATTMVAMQLVISTSDGAQAVVPLTVAPNSPTITVTAASATLNVKKHVITDNGGTASAGDWDLAVNTSNGGTGIGHAVGSEAGTAYTLQAGKQYSVVESGGSSGYLESDSDDCIIDSAVGGATYTCIITNDDITPSLTLDKIVVNDNAGAAHESDWILTATGPTTIFGPGAADSADVVSGASFDQGTYTLSESTGPTGYTASTWSCTHGIAVNGSSQITLGLGQSTVCTITNDDIVQTNEDVNIRVVKTASDYTLRSGPKSVTFTYKVTNTGDVPLSDVTIKDDECADEEYVSGDDNNNDLLDTTEEWKYTCKKTVRKTETNTVTAKGTGNGEEVRDTDTAKVTVSTPGLPNVGVGPNDKNNVLWSIPIQGFFMTLFLF